MSDLSNYFANKAAHEAHLPVLQPRATFCADCAVDCGFYAEYSQALEKEPPEMRRVIASKWFCHNTPKLICFGVVHHLASQVTAREQSTTSNDSCESDTDKAQE